MLPSRCQVCGRWPSGVVCHACEGVFVRHPPRCTRCALVCPPGQTICGACLREPPVLLHCAAAVDYAYPWAALLQRFKFRGEVAWARYLARQMLETPGAYDLLAQADHVLPIPLTRTRLALRGYNQAWELVKALRAGPLARPDWLIKLQDQQEQHTLTRAQRLRLARQAFAVAPHASALLRGRRLLLVDDVMTTGATLNAAADVLLRAGAASVSAWVYARTPLDL